MARHQPTAVDLDIKKGVATITLRSTNQMNPLSTATMDGLLRAGNEVMRVAVHRYVAGLVYSVEASSAHA